ncbi:MAG: 3-hydroxybutyryl-CoA dehydrogenase [Thauera phenolivorans]|uniref:3-hydroxybutyryl-CoA dehydrogenase n=1 Tax=Thauera phenolivorans TaxID=1792543 RepID=A0A7X7R9E9_9RHOO|nr:3-hydroxybutyryl-CoA dehydrogenase [Thauera phenolivorans]NLF55782.1 3-hydroxybutyryl-CoA dehydrogenase [Thauera phenolivorans]
MTISSIRKVGVVGSGTMGSGITQACAVTGLDVIMMDVGEAQVQRGLATISGSLDRLIKREKMTDAQKAETLGHIGTATSLDALAGCDLVIEAASENVDVKLKVFADLDAILGPDAIIASNTSSISITRLAAGTKRSEQVIGMHFFNPVPVMALVELICGLQTSAHTYATVDALAKQIGKTPVKVKNSPGFVVNRMLCPMINEAVFTLGEGLATAEEIDEAMKLGCNHPIGPLALCDLIGLDVELAVMQVLYEGTKDPKYRPAPLLVEMLEAGYLGRKSGKGFFEYK